MNKWKMWNRWKNWKKVLKWTAPFMIITVLVAIFWPYSKALETIPETITISSEIKYGSLGTEASSITIRKAAYTDDSGNLKYIYVYCIEGARGSIGENATMNLDINNNYVSDSGEIQDKGLHYIISNGFSGDASGEMSIDDKNNYAITQLAIWLYHYDLEINNIEVIGDERKSTLAKAIRDGYVPTDETYKSVIDKANELAEGALKARDVSSSEPEINVENNETNLILSDDFTYIESTLMTINLNNLIQYSASLTNDDFVIVDEDGNIKTTFLNGDKIKIRVPTSKVSSNVNVSLNLVATGKKYMLYQYIPDPHEVCLTDYCYIRQRAMAIYGSNDIILEKTIDFKYTLPSGNIEVIKRDSNTGENVIGAKLNLVDVDGIFNETWITDGTTKTFNLNPGTYTLTEVDPPDGYYGFDEAYTIIVNSDGSVNQSKIVIENIPFKELVVSKVDESNNFLEGAILRLVNLDGTLVKEWTTTASSDKIKLGPGTYTLSEVSAPTGYVKSSETTTITVSDDGTISPSSVTFTNKKVEVSVSISKTDFDTGAKLAGAKLKLVDTNGNTVEEWTTETIAKTITLNPGTYTLSEVSAPTGYVKSTETKTITINNDGTTTSNNITFTNKKVEVSVSISKIDEDTKEMLAGAKLKLVDTNGNTVEEWTTTTSDKILTLNPGTYTLSEVSAPTGYVKSTETKTITINNDGTTTSSSVTFTNKKVAAFVTISKIDSVTRNVLVGAKLKLVDSNGILIDEWNTSETSKILTLSPGTYILTEVEAPEWYIKNEMEFKIIVNDDGTTDTDDIVVENVPMQKVVISKQDITNNKELAGAELKIIDENNNEVAKWVSTNEKHSLYLEPGDYKLIENNSPDGYVKSQEEIKFTVKYDGTTSPNEIIMYNVPLREIMIYKKDSKTNQNIAGAELQLVDVDGKIIDTWTSSTSAHTITVVPGKYTLSEINPPKWYVKNYDTIEFDVYNDGSTSLESIIMTNEPMQKVVISKQDITNNKELSGAELKIIDENNNEVARWISTNEKHSLYLEPGNYKLIETTVPDGYVKSQEQIEFTVRSDGSTSPNEIIMYNIPLRKIIISKQDSISKKNIAGARLKLVDNNGNIIDEWESSTSSHTLNVIPGKYILKEVEAPEWYVKNEISIEITVHNDGTTTPSSIVMENKPVKEVVISKQDAITGKNLAGASLKIVDENNNEVANWISTDMPYSIKLKAGTYKLIETKAPNGYIKTENEKTFIVDNEGNTNPANIILDNIPTKVIAISKIDSISGNRIAGAKLRLLNEDGDIVDEWISETVARTFELQSGNYTLEEIEAPQWYIKNNEKVVFTVNNNTDSLKIVMENIPFKDITISKQDMETGKELSGAKLKILDEDNNEVVTWTSGTIPYTLKLNPGVYKLIEISAPEWYVREKNPIEFTVKDDGSVVNDIIIMKNKPMEEVVISKQDITTGKELPGAELKLYDQDNNLIEEWISTDTPYSLKLKAGNYKLIEIKAPEWYVKSSETIQFTVNEDGTTNLGKIVMKNKPTQPVTISKQDITTGKELPGAELKLYNQDNNLIEEWISTDTPYLLKLKAGNYKLIETLAPEWYVKSEETIEFIVNEDGTTNLGKIVMKNKPMQPVTISKQDASSGKNIKGAKLKLMDINDNVIYEWVSDKTSETINLKPGKYLLSEIEAPKGYVKTDEIIEFIVNVDGTTDLGEIIMTNKYIEVPKTDLNVGNVITIACGIFGTIGAMLIFFMRKRFKHV